MDFRKFQLDKIKIENDYDPIPPGEYKVLLTKCSDGPTKDGTGQRVNVQLQILDGKYQNRTLFDGFNVQNKSTQAQEIGQRELAKLCHACGKIKAEKPEDLNNSIIIAKVKVGKDQNGNPRNEIAGYKALVTPSAPAAKAPNLVEQAFGEGEPVASGPKANPWG